MKLPDREAELRNRFDCGVWKQGERTSIEYGPVDAKTADL
jgi:hypothetical protein